MKDSATFQEKAELAARSWMKETIHLNAALNEHAIVAMTDSHGGLIYVNDKFCAISQYSREELLGRNYRILRSGHHSGEFFGDLWRAIQGGRIWHGDVKNRAKDGTFFWAATTIVPSLDDDGKPYQFVIVHTDITQQKRIEAELADKLRLEGLLTDISSRFVSLPSEDVDAAIGETQRMIVETFQVDRCTLWSVAPEDAGFVLTHCSQRPGQPALPRDFMTRGTMPWFEAKLKAGQTVHFSRLADLPVGADGDFELFHRNGVKSCLAIPLIANGCVFGALVFAMLEEERVWKEGEMMELKLVAQIIGNVVSRQRAELREEELRGELVHAMRVASLGELSAALAHELNQPLAAILSNAQAARRFLAGGVVDIQEIGAILDDIVRDDKRAGSVIHNLRAMVSKQPATRELCGMNDLVLEVIQLLYGKFVAENIILLPTLAPGLPEVEVARVEVQQVLVNLLTNAMHAMKETPPGQRFIEIETRSDADGVTVAVRDRGQGIRPERLERIFEPFFSTKATGLGIGLSICRRIVESHGGRIEARNDEAGGAKFLFSIPVRLDVNGQG